MASADYDTDNNAKNQDPGQAAAAAASSPAASVSETGSAFIAAGIADRPSKSKSAASRRDAAGSAGSASLTASASSCSIHKCPPLVICVSVSGLFPDNLRFCFWLLLCQFVPVSGFHSWQFASVSGFHSWQFASVSGFLKHFLYIWNKCMSKKNHFFRLNAFSFP
jgi:hypothetical protein